jgi:hypothetical protein
LPTRFINAAGEKRKKQRKGRKKKKKKRRRTCGDLTVPRDAMASILRQSSSDAPVFYYPVKKMGETGENESEPRVIRNGKNVES